MLLENKNAVIYGAGGSIGGTIAASFAREGAKVFLTGRRLSSLKIVEQAIVARGGYAESEELDATDEQAVGRHAERTAAKAGSIDISFNAVGLQDTQNIPLIDMTKDDFIRPVSIAMTTLFITAAAAGRIMKRQRSGVILSITATPGGIGYQLVGGFGPACCAIESFSRDLAAELGPFNVRVVNIRSAGSPNSRPFLQAIEQTPEEANFFIKQLESDTMLKKLPLMEDIAHVASFLASERSGMITGVTIDVTCGTTAALNYKSHTIPFVRTE